MRQNSSGSIDKHQYSQEKNQIVFARQRQRLRKIENFPLETEKWRRNPYFLCVLIMFPGRFWNFHIFSKSYYARRIFRGIVEACTMILEIAVELIWMTQISLRSSKYQKFQVFLVLSWWEIMKLIFFQQFWALKHVHSEEIKDFSVFSILGALRTLSLVTFFGKPQKCSCSK